MAAREDRAQTVPVKRITRASLQIGEICFPERGYFRPRTRSQCGKIRPCPYVGCRYNLFLDVNEDTGSIKFIFPDKEPWEMKESCALDVAERNGATLDEVGILMNICRERVRQIEESALEKVRGKDADKGLLHELFVMMKMEVEEPDSIDLY